MVATWEKAWSSMRRLEDVRVDAIQTAVRNTSERTTVAIAVIVFLLNAAMVAPVFFPSLQQIGGWDESVYINEGRELIAEGTWPKLSQNPAVAVLYGLTYLPVRSSPYWLVHSCSIGRLLSFSLLWGASFLVARRLASLASPLILVVLIAISPALTILLNNGSNALFAAMSGFALWQILAFHEIRQIRHLWLCSTFVGLAALSRNEGPVLFLTFLGLSVVMCLRSSTPTKTFTAGLAAIAVPFMVLVGGFVATYGLRTGDYSMGVAQRAYNTFEQGHGMAFADTYGALQPYVEGQKDARRLFGTAEENGHSVLRAIRRNPSAYAARIPRLTKSAIDYALAMYGWHFAFFCFVLAARGALELIRTRSFMQLAILALWPAYSILYVLLCFQAAHLLIPFLSVFSLAAFGVTGILGNLDSRTERRMWSVSLLALCLGSAAAYGKPNDLLAAPVVLLVGLWLTWIVSDYYGARRTSVATPALVFLAFALVVRLGIVHTEGRVLGTTSAERATTYLRSRFPPGTNVAAFSPGPVWTANMAHVPIFDFPGLPLAEDAGTWMSRERVEAIYVDHELRTFEPAAWSAIQKQVGVGLEVGFDGTESGPDEAAVLVLVRTGSR
jgi:hypothetical protein